ncbi:ferredoxin--NADP+ reductase [Kribbella voronezhensis]|uniref:ferredoxin--NADP(+) reductase n=1 Tax=Kribbella voronezhensis TaxID=2512212 RepID=A0A4R7SWL0_9ACTN|nr:FAD-dependent oxidoreductase [Kribbella voronezhensis]TDU83740.1 ferredoxin--NADP+ reductase [Kribbella voronezhensis]
MVYVVGAGCCSDASCVAVCPVNCIHPAPGEPDFGRTEGVYIDPQVCIDCGACAEACPVDAIAPLDQLAADDHRIAANANFYADRPDRRSNGGLESWGPPSFDTWGAAALPLRVAIVGAGPAGVYAARELLLRSTARITLLDRLPHVGGLARYGVAPDHPDTRKIVGVLERVAHHPRIRLRLGVEFGPDVDHASLAASHDAVLYALGAAQSRLPGIPGERGEGSCTAADFVAWYNGHPLAGDCPVVLRGPRAVVIGNGNVAIDIARLLLSDPNRLATAELSPTVRRTLADSGIREVVLLGRRGPEHAAYSEAAFREIVALPGITTVLDDSVDLAADPLPGRRLVLRFATEPQRWQDGVLDVKGNHQAIRAGTLISAIGFRSAPVPGLPYDDARGLVPQVDGRVVGMRSTYLTGWSRRGSSGGLGHNRLCAEETVTALLSDASSQSAR